MKKFKTFKTHSAGEIFGFTQFGNTKNRNFTKTNGTFDQTVQTFKNRKTNFNVKWIIEINTNPDFQDHRIDDAANDGDKIEYVPRIFEKILHSIRNK